MDTTAAVAVGVLSKGSGCWPLQPTEKVNMAARAEHAMFMFVFMGGVVGTVQLVISIRLVPQ
jgi:hypothetical protein